MYGRTVRLFSQKQDSRSENFVKFLRNALQCAEHMENQRVTHATCHPHKKKKSNKVETRCNIVNRATFERLLLLLLLLSSHFSSSFITILAKKKEQQRAEILRSPALFSLSKRAQNISCRTDAVRQFNEEKHLWKKNFYYTFDFEAETRSTGSASITIYTATNHNNSSSSKP